MVFRLNFQWRNAFFLCFWSSSVTMMLFVLLICVEIVKMSWHREVYKVPASFNLEDRFYTTVPGCSFFKGKHCSTSPLAWFWIGLYFVVICPKEKEIEDIFQSCILIACELKLFFSNLLKFHWLVFAVLNQCSHVSLLSENQAVIPNKEHTRGKVWQLSRHLFLQCVGIKIFIPWPWGRVPSVRVTLAWE